MGMTLRDGWTLFRMRSPWTALIRWLCWRLAQRERDTLNKEERDARAAWLRVQQELGGGACEDALEHVVDELATAIRDGTLPAKCEELR